LPLLPQPVGPATVFDLLEKHREPTLIITQVMRLCRCALCSWSA